MILSQLLAAPRMLLIVVVVAAAVVVVVGRPAGQRTADVVPSSLHSVLSFVHAVDHIDFARSPCNRDH